MENKLNESEDNKEEGEKGGKKEEVGDKRSPILGRQKKRFAKDDNKNNNNNNNNNNKQEDTDDEIIPGTPQKIKPVRVVKKKYTDYSNHQWCSCSDFAQDLDCKYHNYLREDE